LQIYCRRSKAVKENDLIQLNAAHWYAAEVSPDLRLGQRWCHKKQMLVSKNVKYLMTNKK
jgi:hypothetical protein